MNFQSALGRLQQTYRPDMDMSGFLTAARVLRVHHKSGTADVITVNSKDIFLSSEENEGRYSALILQSFSNYDEERKKSWGTVIPISEGSYVLLAFLDHMKNRPVILGQFPRLDNKENVNPHLYPLHEGFDGLERQEALKSLTVYPSLAYFKVDGESNVEWVHANKSFLALFSEDKYESGLVDEDGHQVLDHEDLSEIDVNTGKPIESDIESAREPANLLYVHRTSANDEETTWTKFYIDKQGKLRITRDNRDHTLSFIEIDSQGKMSFRRQLDSPNHHEGEQYSEVVQDVDGSISLRQVKEGKSSEISITPTGELSLQHHSGSYVVVDEHIYIEANGDILSNSLKKNIQQNHIVVSDSEPTNPRQNLVWIDTHP